uniref:Transmembrane protein n=1 Tax=Nelumbo nucifera TaxID=4432 RepID=A0A822XVP8_NELNU|nr:TPA_asm: hypothetical protein HUJ06_025286 [Nelumbo nucifera]
MNLPQRRCSSSLMVVLFVVMIPFVAFSVAVCTVGGKSSSGFFSLSTASAEGTENVKPFAYKKKEVENEEDEALSISFSFNVSFSPPLMRPNKTGLYSNQ